MSGAKVVTRKLTSFQGRDEEFSNVYYFGNGPAGGQIDYKALINAVITAERPIFGHNVRFLGGSALGLNAFNQPDDDVGSDSVELPVGTAGTASTGAMYKECAIDIRWMLGGRRVLRSLLHTCAPHGFDPDGVAKSAVETNTAMAPLRTFAAAMNNGDFAGCTRMAPNGDRPQGYLINPYLEHRQFHRYRRRKGGLLG